jgi:uncharacterized membrane protein YphA (DoxX/SURF4 family)
MKQNLALIWTGRILTLLISAMLLMSAAMKFSGGKEVADGMAKAGIPESILPTIAVLEVVCVVLYLIPQTAVIGAIMLTGYMGGAIMTHARMEEAPIVQVIFGVMIWLALCLREWRLWSLMPIRTGLIDKTPG